MKKIIDSVWVSWGAFVIVVLFIILTFGMRGPWWSYFDIFFAFMMVFMHLMSVYIGKRLPGVGRQLDSVSFVMGCLMIISFIVEWILMGAS